MKCCKQWSFPIFFLIFILSYLQWGWEEGRSSWGRSSASNTLPHCFFFSPGFFLLLFLPIQIGMRWFHLNKRNCGKCLNALIPHPTCQVFSVWKENSLYCLGRHSPPHCTNSYRGKTHICPANLGTISNRKLIPHIQDWCTSLDTNFVSHIWTSGWRWLWPVGTASSNTITTNMVKLNVRSFQDSVIMLALDSLFLSLPVWKERISSSLFPSKGSRLST